MYKLYATHEKAELHAVHKKKLDYYGFIMLDVHNYLLAEPIYDLTTVIFYQRNLEGPMSPLRLRVEKER